MTDELIRKFYNINPVEYYSAFKKKNPNIYNNLNLEHIMLNKVSQAEKEKHHMFWLICGIQSHHTLRHWTGV